MRQRRSPSRHVLATCGPPCLNTPLTILSPPFHLRVPRAVPCRAQELVKAHNGDIWVESQEGKGSSFTFTLQLAKPIGRFSVDDAGTSIEAGSTPSTEDVSAAGAAAAAGTRSLTTTNRRAFLEARDSAGQTGGDDKSDPLQKYSESPFEGGARAGWCCLVVAWPSASFLGDCVRAWCVSWGGNGSCHGRNAGIIRGRSGLRCAHTWVLWL